MKSNKQEVTFGTRRLLGEGATAQLFILPQSLIILFFCKATKSTQGPLCSARWREGQYLPLSRGNLGGWAFLINQCTRSLWDAIAGKVHRQLLERPGTRAQVAGYFQLFVFQFPKQCLAPSNYSIHGSYWCSYEIALEYALCWKRYCQKY